MNLTPGWRRLFRPSVGPRGIARDVDEELAFHVAMRAENLRQQGLEADAARAQAQERFGNVDRVRDECLTIDRQYAREVQLVESLESLWSDLRFALRTFRRMPTFTLVATITLALGIGATTAMFTLVNSILLRPLPYPHSERLVRVIQSYPEMGLATWGLNPQNVAMYRDRATDFEAFTAYRAGSITLRGNNGPQRLQVLRVTSEFFRVIGVGPERGRTFTAEEDSPGKNTAIILSHGTWQTRFGADPNIVGTTMDVDGQPFRVVGIMPAGFSFLRPEIAAWVPMGLNPNFRFGYANSGLGRLKPGVSLKHAERQTTAIFWDWARSGQGSVPRTVEPSKTQMKTIVRPLQEVFTGKTARPLTVLLAAVVLILLIATANVATLLSGRAAARQREINLRAALGATRARVLRQLLTESVALALLGALVGVALAITAVRLFIHSKLASLPRIEEVGVDGRVLAFTLVVSVASGLLFGILPAVYAGRARLSGDLAAGQRESARGATRRINNALVIGQLSLSVVLLIAAGLVLKSFQRISQIDLGFRPDGITSLRLPVAQRIRTSSRETKAFMDVILERVRAIPGVQSASLTSTLPMQGDGDRDGYLIAGRAVPASGNEDQTNRVAVSPGHFKTVGIPLLFGRDFSSADDSTAGAVAIIDATLAQRYWTGADALGKRIRTTGDTTWYTIIGVAGPIRDDDATLPPAPHMYESLPQVGGSPLTLTLRTNGSTASVLPAVRRVIAEVEPSLPLDDVQTLSAVIDQTFAARRLTKLLLGGFALVGLILAAVGIYGVMSLHVANRGREFGIRLAVGSDPRALLRLVLGEGAVLAGAGVLIGVGAAIAMTRWLSSLLYDVSPTDPVVLVTLPAVLGIVALTACWMPARRAARSDPLAVLRSD